MVPFAVWRGDIATAERVIVRISTDEGITGYGESAVFPFYSEENNTESLVTVKDDFAPMIMGADPFELERITKLMDVVIGHHCTKAAIETALWDIIGRRLGVPVYSLIGGRYYDKLPVVGLLVLGTSEHLAEEARHHKNMGYKTVKIKGGNRDRREEFHCNKRSDWPKRKTKDGCGRELHA
jgi:L-alanine-DL-glutamate epimerase-like enolase superfamily enzyme